MRYAQNIHIIDREDREQSGGRLKVIPQINLNRTQHKNARIVQIHLQKKTLITKL